MKRFDPNISKIEDYRIKNFVKYKLDDCLYNFTGSEITMRKLINEGINTLISLIGKFLILKSDGYNSEDHIDIFYFWLLDLDIDILEATNITILIGNKVNVMIPGTYPNYE